MLGVIEIESEVGLHGSAWFRANHLNGQLRGEPLSPLHATTAGMADRLVLQTSMVDAR